jgi:hypothetical protein
MKYKKLILLLSAFLLGVVSVHAVECCDDGSDPAFDCEDGSALVCDSGDCPPCSTHNQDPATGMICCEGAEVDPSTLTPSFTPPSGGVYSLGTVMVNDSYVVDTRIVDTWGDCFGCFTLAQDTVTHSAELTGLTASNRYEMYSSDEPGDCGMGMGESTTTDGAWSFSHSFGVSPGGVGYSFSATYAEGQKTTSLVEVPQVDDKIPYRRQYKKFITTQAGTAQQTNGTVTLEFDVANTGSAKNLPEGVSEGVIEAPSTNAILFPEGSEREAGIVSVYTYICC